MTEFRHEGYFDELLSHAVKLSDDAQPPPGFAKSIADRVADESGAEAAEFRMTALLVSVSALATAASVVSQIDAVASRALPILNRAPWPLLVTAIASIGVFALAEDWLRRRAARA